MGLFNLGGSEQTTDQTTTTNTDQVATTGGDIVTTDSQATVTSFSGQDITFNNPDPSLGILQSAVDAIAGFSGQALQLGQQSQNNALQFASGQDVADIRRTAINTTQDKTLRNVAIAGVAVLGIFFIFKALK